MLDTKLTKSNQTNTIIINRNESNENHLHHNTITLKTVDTHPTINDKLFYIYIIYIYIMITRPTNQQVHISIA